MDNFVELYLASRVNKESLLGKKVKASMSKRAGKSASYFAIEFELLGKGSHAEAIAQFRQLKYSPDLIQLIESKPDNEETPASNGNGKKAK
jgi:hypothetical protein